MEQLDGRVAVVTGAGSGMGRAMAIRFAAEGMAVVAADVQKDVLDETVAAIRATGAVADAVPTDVRDAAAVEALAEFAYAQHGAVHVVCNNAGVFWGGLMWECDPADFEWVMSVNVNGILHGIRSFVPRMLAGGEEGHIVNTASVAGIAATGLAGPYTVSKFAAAAATECLAHDLVATGAPIGVSLLIPGIVNTAITHSERNRSEVTRTEMGTLVQQFLTAACEQGMDPSEVAGMVVDAIRTNTYLIPTRDSYREQLTTRVNDLVERRLPSIPTFD